ncbi:MAG: CHAT domain-containing protein [Pseudomonadota bacterium]
MTRPRLAFLLAGLGALASAGLAQLPQDRPSVANSFRLGIGGATLCQMQNLATDPAMAGLFDRAYSITCRDAAAPVGRVYALRGDARARLAALRSARVDCPAAIARVTIADLGQVEQRRCTSNANGLPYRVLTQLRGRTTYVAEGLGGYESALSLGLRTIVLDRIVPGELDVAITQAGDAAAFARVQAGSLTPEQALAEGYRRNNAGNYAEAAEFFDTLLSRREDNGAPSRRYGEYLANRALQKSNLGEFAEADALFAQTGRLPSTDPVELRLRRNLSAINLLNQGRLDEAKAVLDTPLAAVGELAELREPVIDADTAAAINGTAPLAKELGVAASGALTPAEKASVLDTQALALRGSLLRLQGDGAGAETTLNQSLARIGTIRSGNVGSFARVRAQALAELAALAEGRRQFAEADRLLRSAVLQLDREYPASLAVNAANARLAAFLARRGRADEAIALYRVVVANTTAAGGATIGFEALLRPYFQVLAARLKAQPALVADFFLASQALVRPGVADTQAVLTRELSSGDDAAAALFRQSVNLAREVESTRVRLTRLAAVEAPTAVDAAGLSTGRAALTTLEQDQAAVQSRLSQYPRYRVLANRTTTLAELTSALKPGEGYWKLIAISGEVYSLYATRDGASAWRVPLTTDALDRAVDKVRFSIAHTEGGQLVTEPFDVATARKLYMALAGPAAAQLPKAQHLIFEPDGAMLRLPPSLLVTDQAGVDRYLKRIADPKADAFDLTGIAWLARATDISTSVSARTFQDVRAAAASTAKQAYLGFGQNAPPTTLAQLRDTRPVAEGQIDCRWPLRAWNQPISARELVTAEGIIGRDRSAVVTGAAFSDTAIRARGDLNQYRILHFATHGLVAAPRPECPARPALLTSFGGKDSDGLLSFREIYALKIDADLVILSACDTAGTATVDATREAGVLSGGGRALDGLVRAFVGAGSRAVLATHWPAPDDYRATERLISAVFQAPPGTTVAAAVRGGERALMDTPDTSHPYYWAAFALVGDGAKPVLAR